jgi:hypothetical protein
MTQPARVRSASSPTTLTEATRNCIAEYREDHNLPTKDPILFLEVEVCDASEFADVVKVEGLEVGVYRVLRVESSGVPNAIASFFFTFAT